MLPVRPDPSIDRRAAFNRPAFANAGFTQASAPGAFRTPTILQRIDTSHQEMRVRQIARSHPHLYESMRLTDARSSGLTGLKSVADRVLALLMIMLLAPLMLAIALLIRLDSPGPIVFRQRRYGLHNAVFNVLKFRTMRHAPPAACTGAEQTRRGDPRLTRVGAFLRRCSLDELPQLVNVLRGEMSLVGPRPHPVDMRTQGFSCEELVAQYAQRHSVKPGLTGLAQINGLRGATETADQLISRVHYDLYYIRYWSPWLDLRIMLQTPWALFASRHNAF